MNPIPRRLTRRDEIFEWGCRYADEMDGPTPSINEIAVHFKLNYKTVYYHVMKLIVEGRLRQERGKLVVVGSEWIEPVTRLAQQEFDF
jgi:DNA-binding transcriptional regulator YhcF (GntR family)